MKKRLIDEIKSIIQLELQIGSSGEQIAFYGLTSKSEAHYRDAIAFHLYRRFSSKYLISREWKKCDLAILDKNTHKPLLLLELKVCYNVDLYKPSTIKEYVDSVKKDLRKSKDLSDKGTEIYSIVFIFSPEQLIPKNLYPIVKYANSINSGLRKMDYKTLKTIGETNLKNEFQNIEFNFVRRGNVYGINCNLEYCIIGEDFKIIEHAND